MATIRIRDVPDDAYEVLRGRARSSGQSMQASMLAQVVSLAAAPSKAAQLAAVEARLATGAVAAAPAADAVQLLEADRR